MISVASLFAQVLSLISRRDFAKAVLRRDAEKASKGFSCRDQFVAMLFCQLGGANSLGEICGGLATAMGKLRHLGLLQASSRSTLSYANSHRPWELFEDVLHSLLGQACRDLWKWLDDPYRYPASEPVEYALPLFAHILDSKTG